MKNSKIIDIILLITVGIIGLILSILFYVGIEFIQTKIFVPSNYILFTFKTPASYLIFLFEIEIIITAFVILNNFRKSSKWKFAIELYTFAKKHSVKFITLNIVLFYIALTSVAVVTSDKIIDFNFYNPKGTIYAYDDIKSVETGFYDKKIGFIVNNSGDFYYKVKFKDNKKINFQNAVSRYEDTYTEYIEFDELVMANKVQKTYSTKNANYSNLDKVYLNRLYKVINNKN